MSVRIHIQGNCQCRSLADILKEGLPTAKISWCEVYQPLGPEARLQLQDDISKADIVLLQPALSKYLAPELQSDNVKEMLKPGAQSLVFPVVYHRGQLPSIVNLKRDGTSFKIPGIVYADVVILYMMLQGLDDQDIAARLHSRDLFEAEHIRAISKESLAALAERERQSGCDIRVTPLLQEENGKRQVFHTFNHPDRSVLTRIAREALDLAGLAARLPDYGEDVLRYPHFPVLPSVAAALGMAIPCDEDLRIEFQTQPLELLRYVGYVRRCITAVEPRALFEALEQTPGASDIWSAVQPPRKKRPRSADNIATWLRGWL